MVMSRSCSPTSRPPTFELCDKRWHHTRSRRRLLESEWELDLLDRLSLLLSDERRAAWGPGDTTKNNFKSVVLQLSTLYNKRGAIKHQSVTSAKRLDEIMAGAGWWQLAIRHHRDVVGLRESLVRVSVHGEGDEARLQLRLVKPDLVYTEANPDEPDIPHTVTEWRPRMVLQEDGKTYLEQWTRDVLSIKDPESPTYRVFTGDGKQDLTAEILKTDGSWPARWRDSKGKPVMPYVLYHAVRTGQMWDEREGMELVSGSLTLSVLWTYWNHVVRDASHPQRVAVNAKLGGAPTMTEVNGREVATIPEDPTAILLFEQVKANAPVQFHQFAPGGDPEALGRAIRDYAADLAVDYGIKASDIERTHGNAQSGFAVQLSNKGVRRAQQQYTPGAERGDAELFRVVAVLWNRATGSTASNRPLAEDGYGATYEGLEVTNDERQLQLEEQLALKDAGLASSVDVYMAMHDCTRPMAIENLKRIQQENALVASFSAQPIGGGNAPRDQRDPRDPADGAASPAAGEERPDPGVGDPGPVAAG